MLGANTVKVCRPGAMALAGLDQIGQSYFGEDDVIEGDISQNFEKRPFRLRKQEPATEIRSKRC